MWVIHLLALPAVARWCLSKNRFWNQWSLLTGLLLTAAVYFAVDVFTCDYVSSYYDLLGVPADSPGAAVTSAGRRLLAALHPDVSGKDTSQQFSAVREAMEVLSSTGGKYRRFGDYYHRSHRFSVDDSTWMYLVLFAVTRFAFRIGTGYVIVLFTGDGFGELYALYALFLVGLDLVFRFSPQLPTGAAELSAPHQLVAVLTAVVSKGAIGPVLKWLNHRIRTWPPCPWQLVDILETFSLSVHSLSRNCKHAFDHWWRTEVFPSKSSWHIRDFHGNTLDTAIVTMSTEIAHEGDISFVLDLISRQHLLLLKRVDALREEIDSLAGDAAISCQADELQKEARGLFMEALNDTRTIEADRVSRKNCRRLLSWSNGEQRSSPLPVCTRVSNTETDPIAKTVRGLKEQVLLSFSVESAIRLAINRRLRLQNDASILRKLSSVIYVLLLLRSFTG